MVTSLYAGILGLIYVGLSIYVIVGRFKHQINLSDGGNEDMLKRIRVHANFMEYVPIALILMVLGEVEGVSEIMVHILGCVLVIGRIFHPLGVLNVIPSVLGRRGGMILTLLVIIVAAVLCIKSYFFLGIQ